MENIININNTKENALEFEMIIEGMSTAEVECNFVIVAKGMELRFDAILESKEDNKWLVKLPKLDLLERTSYNCYTEVIAEGQYFKPMTGSVNVVGTSEIYTSSPKNLTIESDQQKQKEFKTLEEKRDVKRTSQAYRQNEKSIAQIAEELMGNQKYDAKGVERLVEEKQEARPETDRESKIRAILEEAGIKPKAKKKERISFIKTRLLNS